MRRQNQRNDSARKPQYGGKRDSRKKSPKGKRNYSASSEANITSADNDISWYSKYPDLLVSAASVPYPYRPGMSLRWGNYTQGTPAVNYTLTTPIPGVAVLSWAPTIGDSYRVTDPINVVGKELYAQVRKVFSGALVADPPDFIMYLIALDSIFSYIGALKRIYRILDAYNPETYNVPGTLLNALGMNDATINGLRQNKPQFLMLINQLVYQTRKFNLPTIMDFFTRHYWMNDNVFLDAPSPRGQMYTFRQDGFWKYSEKVFIVDADGNKTSNQAGGLEYAPAIWLSFMNTTNVLNVNTLYNFGLNLIEALANSEDAYTISGYLARAYEGGNFFTVDPLVGNEPFEPAYSEEVLAQIENSFGIAKSAPTATSSIISNLTIAQQVDTNAVYWRSAINGTSILVNNTDFPGVAPLFGASILLTSRSDNPTPAETVIATRLHGSTAIEFINGKSTTIAVTGTEIPFIWTIYYPVIDPTTGLPSAETVEWSQLIASMPVPEGIAAMTNFDWFPIAYVNSDNKIYALGDLHNPTLIKAEQLADINRVCLLSEFNAFNI